MANEALFKRIEFFQRLTHYGKREDFLDSLAQVAPATEPKFTKEQEDQYYGSQLAKSKPTALPKPISLHTEKPAQPPLYTQPNQQPAKQKTVAPAPDLQKQLQDAFGPNYVPPAKQAQVRQPTRFENRPWETHQKAPAIMKMPEQTIVGDPKDYKQDPFFDPETGDRSWVTAPEKAEYQQKKRAWATSSTARNENAE